MIIFDNMDIKTQQITQLIKQNIHVIDSKAEVILYGSRARGDARVDSDWDLLVLTDYPVDLKKESVFRDQVYELELEIGEPMSIFVYSRKDWTSKQRITPFYHNVVKEGIRLC